MLRRPVSRYRARLTDAVRPALFVDVPNPSISWIYASIGCQHSLQPTPDDDFAPPSVPALTSRGFVRWQSIEILLGPEEHVPFIQTAVKNFAIKNPDTGDTFPVDLPTSAFPLVPDKAIERWHNSCAEKLRQRATPNETPTGEDDTRPDLPPRTRVRTGFTHVRPEHARDYFEPKSRSRPIPYQHVSATGPSRPQRPKLSRSPTHQARQFLAPEAPSSPYNRGRRRSFPENPSSPSSPLYTHDIPLPKEQPSSSRRHSHPRHSRRGSVSSDASASSGGEDVDEPPSPKNTSNGNYVPAAAAGAAAGVAAAAAAATRRKSHPPRDDPPIIRFAPAPSPTQPVPTAASAAPEGRPRRRISRERAATVLSEEEEDTKRQSFAIPIDLTGKLSAPFLLGNRERPKRNDSRGPTVTWKDITDVPLEGTWRRGSKSSEEDRTTPRLSRKPNRHESEKEREGDSGSSGTRRRRGNAEGEARPPLRERRYSSHEDVMRRKRDTDRDYDREREWEREMAGRGFRNREREGGRRGASPVRGVDGRKYPSAR